MQIRVKKSIGNAFVNLVRQLLMSDIPEYRPVAFRVGDNSNVLSISDTVEEDMTEFISKFCQGDFVALGDEKIAVVKLSCEKVLSLSDVKSKDLAFSGKDVEVLHALSPINVEILFRLGSGNYSSDENIAFLNSKGIDTDSYVCVSSRHCLIKNFTFTSYDDADDEYVNYDIELTCKAGVQESTLLSLVSSRLTELVKLLN